MKRKKLLLVGIGSLVGLKLSELDLSSFDVYYTTRDIHKCKNDPRYLYFDLDDADPTRMDRHFDACVYMADLPKIFSLIASGCTFNRLIAFSTSSVLTKASSTHSSDIELVNEFGSAEYRLKDWCMTESVSLVVLRPTLIYLIGRDRNLTIMKKFIQKYRFFPLVGDYQGLRKPVSADDLARLTIAILAKEVWSRQCMTFTVAGGEVMSFRELIERLFLLSEVKPRFIPINRNLFIFTLRVLNAFGLMRNIGAEMVEHAEMDFVFDNAEIYQEFGFVPQVSIS